MADLQPARSECGVWGFRQGDGSVLIGDVRYVEVEARDDVSPIGSLHSDRAKIRRLREALARIERLQDRWSAPLTHPVGDMSDPAYAGAAAWAAVGSEAHKIAKDAIRA